MAKDLANLRADFEALLVEKREAEKRRDEWQRACDGQYQRAVAAETALRNLVEALERDKDKDLPPFAPNADLSTIRVYDEWRENAEEAFKAARTLLTGLENARFAGLPTEQGEKQ